ncbi:phospholipase D family protein [Labrys okinawensis]|uniref:phospholipase D family nuclease n=1 Tax=Labrys okinawensis TaxID=346911 RepID=UPI0039BCAF82
MKKIVAAIICALFIPQFAVAEPIRRVLPPSVSVCFTPGEDCEAEVVEALKAATKQVLIQAYGFTSIPILQAVKAAANRGVEVLVILDKSNDRGKYSAATYLTNNNIPVWIDTTPGIAHNKVMVIDHARVITGSYNFTKAAKTRNAENLLVIFSPPVAREFEANWDARLKASKAYGGVDEPSSSSVAKSQGSDDAPSN